MNANNGPAPSSLSAPGLSTANRVVAALELVVAAALWGFGFIATVWALRAMGPLAITGYRFAIGAAAGFAISLAIPRFRRSFSREQFRLALWPGLFLCATLVLQTWGLKYTTATKSGFITTLYVLIVPVMERIWLKKRLPKYHFVYVILAIAGVALVCDLGSLSQAKDDLAKRALNLGDLLTVGAAIAASLQILWFGVIQKRIGSAFLFNNYQSLWAGVLPLGLALAIEPFPHLSFVDSSATGLLILAFGSTLIAFALQVRAQKTISPSVASLLFLLESPFATLFAIGFLAESLHSLQWVGAGLILLAAALSTAFSAETA